MDPVTLIVSALVSGASAATKDTASAAVKGAFQRLNDMIRIGVKGDAPAEMALMEAPKDAETWQKPLEKAVTDHRLGNDQEVVALARQLLELIESGQPSVSKYDVDIKSSKGVVIGDHAKVDMVFEESPDRPTEKDNREE